MAAIKDKWIKIMEAIDAEIDEWNADLEVIKNKKPAAQTIVIPE